MSRNAILRMAVDLAMTVLLLLLMGYSLVGETAHEWLGIGMLALFVVHHVLNRRWLAGLLRGRYSPARSLRTVLAGLLLLTMLGSAVSGVLLSKHIFRFSALGGAWFARTLHMLCGYWNFVLMSLHLGVHWVTILGRVGKRLPKGNPALTWAARAAAALIAAYGVYALITRQIGRYLLGLTAFAMFDGSQPLVWFLLDYLAVMGLFVGLGHNLSKCLNRNRPGRNEQKGEKTS